MSEQNKERSKDIETQEALDNLNTEDIENTKTKDEDNNEENKVASENETEKVKKSNSNKKIKKDKKDEQIEDLTDRLKRTMAEFDNYRKRTEKEKSQMYEIGARNIVEKILPVIDNFERGLLAVTDNEDPFAQGIERIYKQLMSVLEESGVKVIEALDQPFDLNYHNAVMHIEDEELGENIIVEEFQKGYIYKDTVVRHSMVKVAN